MNWTPLENSLIVAGGTTIAPTIIGLLSALLLASVGPVLRRLMLGMAVLGLALPPFLVTNTWLDLLGETGAWRALFPFAIFSLTGTIWVLTLLLWPIMLLLTWAGLQKLEGAQLELESALIGWRLIRWLVLPVAGPALAGGAALTFVLALNNFAVPAILQAKVYPAELWVSFNTTFDYAAALKLSWPLFVLPWLILPWIGGRIIHWPRITGALPAKIFRHRLGTVWFMAGFLASALALFMSVAVPLAQLAMAPRTWLELPGALAAGQHAVLNSLV